MPALQTSARTALLLSFSLLTSFPSAALSQDGTMGAGMPANAEMTRMWALADPADATITAENDGDWSNGNTWNLNRAPTTGDRVYIPEGRHVDFDIVSSDSLRTLRLDGTLAFATERNTALIVDTLIGGMGSVLTLGTEATPVQAQFNARLVFSDYDDPNDESDGGFERRDPESADFDPAMLGLGLITHGRFESAGAARAHGGTLSAEPVIGDQQLALAFEPSGWQPGDEIVIAGTQRDALGDEKRIIAAISERLITLDRPLDKDHTTVGHSRDGLALAVHVINLERNVVIETNDGGRAPTTTDYTYTNDDLRQDFTFDLFHDRGHIMFMHSNNVTIRHTRFHALGRTSKHGAIDDNQFDSDGTLTHAGMNPRARYALHFHRAGLDGVAGLVEGSVADSNPGWCYVNHGSHVNFIDNVAYDCDGAAFVTERGDELGSFVSNIAIRNTADEAKRSVALRFQARKPINDFGFGGHGFWLQGINVIARDNVSSGAGREAFALYPLLFDDADQTRFELEQIAPEHRASFSAAMAPDEAPAYSFKGNIAYGSNIGLMVGEHRPDAPSVIEGFTGWKVRMGTSFNYSDSIHFDRLTLIGSLEAPEGLGTFAHHGTSQVTMDDPHVEGFAIGIQLPRAGNQAIDLARFKYSEINDAYLNNVLNLHILQIRSHDFLHADIRRPRFGTLSDSALASGLAALAAVAQTDDLNIDSSNIRSNGFTELATEVAENRFNAQQDYYLHYTQTAGGTADTRHQRDSFLPRRITVTDTNDQQWRLFFKTQQSRDFIPFPTSVYHAGVDYDLSKPLDRDAPGNNRNSNLPVEFLDKTVAQIADQFQRDSANAHWADFAWAKDRIGSRWDVDAATDYPGFALAPGGRLLPSNHATDARFQTWDRTSNLVAMRVDDLPDYIDYAGRDLESEAQVLDADSCSDLVACLPELNALDGAARLLDDETENGRSLLVDGMYDLDAPFSLAYKSFTLHANLRPLDTHQGMVMDAGDATSGFRIGFSDDQLVAVLNSRDTLYTLESDALTAGDWIHMGLMVNQGLGEAILTINGDRVDSVAITPFRSSGGDSWRIGGPLPNATGANYLGYMDDLTFSERTYTDDGLSALAANSVKPAPLQSGRDADGDGYADVMDRFPLDGDEHSDNDRDGLGDVADTDDDNDGIPDAVEIHYALDPFSATDAHEDLDGDGISNIDEHLSATILNMDDVAPWVTAPVDLTIGASGALTSVDLGVASAGDARDGQLIATPSPVGPYAPGRHDIRWRVSDAAGNEAHTTQQLIIEPQLFISGPSLVGEGTSAQLTLALNGPAATYPVLIPYHFEGSASEDDFSPAAGTLEIATGQATTLDIDIHTDSLYEGDDTIEFVIGEPENARIANSDRHTITVREANIAPQVSLDLYQDGALVDAVDTTKMSVQLRATVTDSNPSDQHTFDWSASDAQLLNAVVSSGTGSFGALTIDVTELDTGTYPAVLRVTDDGDGQLTGTAQFSLVILSAVANNESEEEEPDFPDNPDADQSNEDDWLLSLGDGRSPVSTTPGYVLRPGALALAAGNDSPTIESIDHAALSGTADYLHESNAPRQRFTGDVLDIEIHDVTPGGTATLVFPVTGGLPADAHLRILSSDGNWFDFVTTDHDYIASLRGDTSACPATTDPGYTPELDTGDYCTALFVTDGGINDTDKIADGVVRLSFGIGFMVQPEPTIAAAMAATPETLNFTQSGEHEVLAFTLSSDDIGSELHGLTLQAGGELNEVEQLETVGLYVDRNANGVAEATEALGRGHYVRDNATLDFELISPHPLAVGENAFLITYTLRSAR